MTNNQKYRNWDSVLILCQIIYLMIASAFIYQQKNNLAVGLLFFPSGIIGFGKNTNSVVKFLNRVILTLTVIMTLYWLYEKFYLR